MPKSHFCPLPSCRHSSRRSDNLHRHVQRRHGLLFKESHTFVCCNTRFPNADLLLKHLASDHGCQRLTLVNRGNVLHLQPRSASEGNEEDVNQDEPQAVEGDDGLNDTPSGGIEQVDSALQESNEAPSSQVSGIYSQNVFGNLFLPLLGMGNEDQVNREPYAPW